MDVEEFIDIAAALRQPPLSAKTNDSTGFHVHVGRAFGRGNFFAMEEVAAIAKAWCTFEETLSSFILPLARRGNAYCRDLRDILGAGARRGSSTTAAALRHVDDVVALAEGVGVARVAEGAEEALAGAHARLQLGKSKKFPSVVDAEEGRWLRKEQQASEKLIAAELKKQRAAFGGGKKKGAMKYKA